MRFYKIFITYNLEIFLTFLVFLLDQLTKYLIEKNYALYETRAVIKNIFSFTFVKNSGAIFGFFHNNNILILCLIICISLLFLFLIRKDFLKIYLENYDNKFFRIFVCFFLGGALGNIADRIFRGYVVDFFDFHIWPVFNVADSFIFLAMVYFIFFSFSNKKN